MARGFYQNIAALAQADGTLKALSAINVFLYQPGTTTLATMYSGRTGASTLTNPIITDATGIVEFYADVGEYDVRFRDTNVVPRIADRTVSWESVNTQNDGIPYSKIDTGSGIPFTDLTISQSDLLALLAAYAIRPGDLKATARATAETGWLMCDGSAVSRTTYAALWAAINGGHAGNAGDPAPYGNGDGTATFNLPNLSGRAPIGAGTATGAAGATAHALGQTAGEEKHTLTNAEMPIHSHVISVATGAAPGSGLELMVAAGGTSAARVTSQEGGSAGVTQPHNIMQPFQVVNYMIKT